MSELVNIKNSVHCREGLEVLGLLIFTRCSIKWPSKFFEQMIKCTKNLCNNGEARPEKVTERNSFCQVIAVRLVV